MTSGALTQVFATRPELYFTRFKDAGHAKMVLLSSCITNSFNNIQVTTFYANSSRFPAIKTNVRLANRDQGTDS